MAMARSPWRALRPVLLAGAATLSWLTLSSPAASADVLSDTTSLVGGVTSSVSPVTGSLATPAPVAPAAGPAPAAPATAPASALLLPVAGQVSGLADNLVSAVPVVNRVVPAGTVTVVSVPIAGVAEGAAAAVVDVVVPRVASAVPVLVPVLQPVTELVSGAVSLPVAVSELPELPDLPVLPVPVDAGLSGAGASVSTGDQAAAGDPGTLSGSPAAGVAVAGAVAGPDFAVSPAGAVAPAGTSSVLFTSVGAAASGVDAGQQHLADPSPVPAQVPAVPGSGAGSGTSTAGFSGSLAWLSSFGFDLPVTGAVRAGETSEHVPAPVSFDPGSSPD